MSTMTGPRIMEGKPWDSINSDGSLNLGSYAVTAAVGMVELAHELLLAREADLGYDEMADRPTGDELRKLARTLLQAADIVQANVRNDGHVARMDNSHTRARVAVRSALLAYPVPWHAEAAAKKAWFTDLTEWATTILRTAVALVEED